MADIVINDTYDAVLSKRTSETEGVFIHPKTKATLVTYTDNKSVKDKLDEIDAVNETIQNSVDQNTADISEMKVKLDSSIYAIFMD